MGVAIATYLARLRAGENISQVRGGGGRCGSDLTRKPPSLPPLTGAVPERVAALYNVCQSKDYSYKKSHMSQRGNIISGNH